MDKKLAELLSTTSTNPHLTEFEKKELLKYSFDLAKYLMRLHGMQPPNRKKRVSRRFENRGQFDVSATVLKTLMSGAYSLRETRRERVQKERPRVAILLDTSGSMANTGVVKPALLLCLALIEFFGNGFARDFYLTFIGDYCNSLPPLFANQTTEEVKKAVVESVLWENGTYFIPAFNVLEQASYYDGKDPKFIFAITDGYPETWTTQSVSGNKVRNLNAEPQQIMKIVRYVRERWENNESILFFWIQLADEDRGKLYDLLGNWFGYCVDKNEFDPNLGEHKYNHYKRLENKNDSHYPLGEYFYELWQKKLFFLTTPSELGSEEGLNALINFLLNTFGKYFGL